MENERFLKEEINQMILETLTISDGIVEAARKLKEHIQSELTKRIADLRRTVRLYNMEGSFPFTHSMKAGSQEYKMCVNIRFIWFRSNKDYTAYTKEHGSPFNYATAVQSNTVPYDITMDLTLPVTGNGQIQTFLNHVLEFEISYIAQGLRLRGVVDYTDAADGRASQLNTDKYRSLVDSMHESVVSQFWEEKNDSIDELICSTEAYKRLLSFWKKYKETKGRPTDGREIDGRTEWLMKWCQLQFAHAVMKTKGEIIGMPQSNFSWQLFYSCYMLR